MNIFEFAKMAGTEVRIEFMQSWLNVKHMNGDIWICELKRVETKNGGILSGNFGSGKTPQSALNDYCKNISNKKAVVNAMEKGRKEFDLPQMSGTLSDMVILTRSSQ